MMRMSSMSSTAAGLSDHHRSYWIRGTTRRDHRTHHPTPPARLVRRRSHPAPHLTPTAASPQEPRAHSEPDARVGGDEEQHAPWLPSQLGAHRSQTRRRRRHRQHRTFASHETEPKCTHLGKHAPSTSRPNQKKTEMYNINTPTVGLATPFRHSTKMHITRFARGMGKKRRENPARTDHAFRIVQRAESFGREYARTDTGSRVPLENLKKHSPKGGALWRAKRTVAVSSAEACPR